MRNLLHCYCKSRPRCHVYTHIRNTDTIIPLGMWPNFQLPYTRIYTMSVVTILLFSLELPSKPTISPPTSSTVSPSFRNCSAAMLYLRKLENRLKLQLLKQHCVNAIENAYFNGVDRNRSGITQLKFRKPRTRALFVSLSRALTPTPNHHQFKTTSSLGLERH